MIFLLFYNYFSLAGRKIFPFFFLLTFCYSCVSSQKNYSPQKKFFSRQLQEDYSLLRNILEKKHPSLYWYTSKDSMDKYFDQYYLSIKDSMTEMQFGWNILAPLIDKIHCGHTSFGMSKAYNQWAEDKRFASFPLFMKIWSDTMVITFNLNRKDSVLKRGTLITSIDGVKNKLLIETMLNYMTEDGYANNVNYARLSNNFPYYHRNIFGLYKKYRVNYRDSSGKEQSIQIPLFEIKRDSTRHRVVAAVVKKTKKERRRQKLAESRSFIIDSVRNTAILTINTFSNGRLRSFFRQSFKKIKKQRIAYLILDLRSNGGGKINLSSLLTKYVTRRSFKVADSCFARVKSLRPYTKYIKGGVWNNIALAFSTRKKKDGAYHFGYWERKLLHPKKQNHFNGQLYVLTGGSTFSASSLFCNVVKGQPGIQLVGEETGGGWHGNNGVMIPDIVLPHTKLQVRLPLFRLVQYQHIAKTGTGIIPDIHIGPDYDALIKGIDKKMQVVRELIQQKQETDGLR